MQNIFQHYSAPKESHKNNEAIMEKARFTRLEILKKFLRSEAEAAGINYQPVADLLSVAPELTSGKTSAGVELTKKEKYRYALLSIANSAVFAFQLIDVPQDELTVKVAAIEKNVKMGLGIAPIQESANKLKETYPKVAHMLECSLELINSLSR